MAHRLVRHHWYGVLSSPAKGMLSISSVAVLLWLPCCYELITLNQSECGMSDADMTLLQMSKLSEDIEMSQKEFADGLKCPNNEDSFRQTGGDFVWVWPWAGIPGLLWGDLLATWEKGPNNERFVQIDYVFFSREFQLTDYGAVALDFGVTTFPMTLWVQHTFSINPVIPMKKAGCHTFPRVDDGLYVLTPDIFQVQSGNFDSAGWPKSLHPDDLIVDGFEWRVRGRGKIKGVKLSDDEMQLSLRFSVYLELRPVFRDPGPVPTTTTTTPKKQKYSSRRREVMPPVPLEVIFWCEIKLEKMPCWIWVQVVPNPVWRCMKACYGDGDVSNSVSSIDYKYNVAPSNQSVAGVAALQASYPWGRRRRSEEREVRVPSSFIFNTPELRSLLSDEEKQRLQQFMNSTKPTHPVPPDIFVIDGDCPESLPYTIGGGCKCKISKKLKCLASRSYLKNGRWYCSISYIQPPYTAPYTAMSICSDSFKPPKVVKVEGKLAVGVKATCTEGTLIGGSCDYKGAENYLFGWITSYPVDASTFMCQGKGDISQEPEIDATAVAHCLVLRENQNVTKVTQLGDDTASAKCPDGYRVVGGGCNFKEGVDFRLTESYPTTRNTWECIFKSTTECGEGSPYCLWSEAYALCLGFLSY